MYSVLIVDDEEPVLESYSYLVESALEDFSVCGTARSGSEALSIAHRERPDVVLMDIAMPGIDGLDTIRELQHEFPDSLYILSTAYERFDLAQRAIPLHVFAYLVKPVSRKTFLETMFGAKDHLDAGRLETAGSGRADLEHELSEFMLQLTWKSFDEAAWMRYRRLFGISGDGGLVAAVALSERELYPRIAERIERRYRCLWGEYARRMLVFIPEQAPQDSVRRYLAEVLRDIVGTAPAVGVGGRRRYDELFRSSDEALAMLPGIGDTAAELRRYRERARAFARHIALAGSFTDIEPDFQDFLAELFRQWNGTVARNRLIAFTELMIEDLGRRLSDEDTAAGLADPAAELAAMSDQTDLREIDAWFRGLLRHVIEYQQDRAGESWPEVLARAVRYVDREYQAPLQLSGVAEYCGVSVGYLSRLFSEHLHVSFTDHLNTVRLKAAEELLRTTRQPIKEIAYAVGYHSPNYFSRIFRKYKGFPPTEYPRARDHDL